MTEDQDWGKSIPKKGLSVAVALGYFNLALRGLMEFGIVLALGYWGLRAGETTIARIFLSIGAPLLIFGFWGLVDFRQVGRLAEPLRLLQELAIIGLAAFALYTVGQHALAWVFALISIVHHALVYLLGGNLLKK